MSLKREKSLVTEKARNEQVNSTQMSIVKSSYIPNPGFSPIKTVISSKAPTIAKNLSIITINSQSTDIESPSYSMLTCEKSKETNDENTFKFKTPVINKIIKQKLSNLDISVNVIKEQDFSFSSIVLGQGVQGIVYKGKYLGSDVAIKSIPIIKEKVKYLLREIALLDNIRHPNIISVMAVCPTDTKCHIIMEFFKSHSLQDIIFNRDKGIHFKLDLTTKRKIALDSSYAVAYLHLQPQPIIHRDIKPANILINEHCLTRLCDLGLGKSNSFCDSLDSTYQGRWRGPLPYMAPEILLDNEEANESSDIWSLACTFIELFSGYDKNIE